MALALKLLGKTPPFRGPDGRPLPGSVAEVRFVELGGVDQWVMIRGKDAGNPPLLFLHGGPGLSETGLFRYFNSDLEKIFTVVYWDQRGAGRSRSEKTPPSSLTVERLLMDLDELVDLVRRRLGASKVVIFGHSWGSALGVLYAARFPHKVAAYVGSGQIGNWSVGEALSYEYALGTAERRRHRRALKALRSIGPPPHDAAGLFTERTWLQVLDGQLRPRALLKMLRVVLGTPESSLREVGPTFRAFRAVVDAMWPEVSKLNLIERVPELAVPTFFFLGRHDHFVPSAASMAYVNVLKAPSKEVVWFEESGHEPFMDEPVRFNAAMKELASRLNPQDTR